MLLEASLSRRLVSTSNTSEEDGPNKSQWLMGGRGRSQEEEEECLTLSALGAVDHHAGDVGPLEAKFRETTQEIRTRWRGSGC